MKNKNLALLSLVLVVVLVASVLVSAQLFRRPAVKPAVNVETTDSNGCNIVTLYNGVSWNSGNSDAPTLIFNGGTTVLTIKNPRETIQIDLGEEAPATVHFDGKDIVVSVIQWGPFDQRAQGYAWVKIKICPHSTNNPCQNSCCSMKEKCRWVFETTKVVPDRNYNATFNDAINSNAARIARCAAGEVVLNGYCIGKPDTPRGQSYFGFTNTGQEWICVPGYNQDPVVRVGALCCS